MSVFLPCNLFFFFELKFPIGLEYMLGLVNRMTACLLLAGTYSAQAEPVPAVPPLYTVDCTHVLELPGMNIFIKLDDQSFSESRVMISTCFTNIGPN